MRRCTSDQMLQALHFTRDKGTIEAAEVRREEVSSQCNPEGCIYGVSLSLFSLSLSLSLSVSIFISIFPSSLSLSLAAGCHVDIAD